MPRDNEIYIGYDLNDNYSQICYLKPGMDFPESLSSVTGGDNYLIPTVICKRNNSELWIYGEEAIKCSNSKEGVLVDKLLERSLKNEYITIEHKSYSAIDLLGLFIRKTFNLISAAGDIKNVKHLVIASGILDYEHVQVLRKIIAGIPLEHSLIDICDYKESFYEYMIRQNQELLVNDAVLFKYDNNNFKEYFLSKNKNTTPWIVDIKEQNFPELTYEFSDTSISDENKDTAFVKIIEKSFENRKISCVYLAGEVFEGDWMRASTRLLCKNRKVFLGQNLFVQGAAYMAMNKSSNKECNMIYLGEYKIKSNILVNIIINNEETPYPLIEIGTSWYNADTVFDVILNNDNKVDFIIRGIGKNNEKIESIFVGEFENRPQKITRLRISLNLYSQNLFDVVIQDLGFGEIFESVGIRYKKKIEI